MWFKLLQGGEIKSTAENLKTAAEGENYEWTDMYDRMAQEAKEEGFDHIAYLFTEVGKIEKEHEARYLKLLENVEEGLVFSKDGDEFGNAEIVDILLLEKVLQKFVLFVAIQKLILKLKQKIISRRQNFLLSFFCKGLENKFKV